MKTSEGLTKAKKVKNDEFYTFFEDIAKEVPRYRDQLRGQRVLCPCDENESNFVKFLEAHIDSYEMLSVSASVYNPVTKEGTRFQDINYSKYDVVITNPPFSQFREFIKTMLENELKFLVIGPFTGIAHEDTLNYIRDNRMWIGYSRSLNDFQSLDGKRVSAPVVWYTNLDVSYRQDKMILVETYSPEKYPKYYNYNGINVDRVKEIPYNYPGIMGVPLTFLIKYNPSQFEIIGQGNGKLIIEEDGKPGRAPFERILIRNKQVIEEL